MKKQVLLSASAVAFLGACATQDNSPVSPSATTANFQYELAVPGKSGDTPAAVHAARGVRNDAGKPGRQVLLTNHGGPIRSTATTVYPIYWGTSWTNATFAGDKITGLKNFYTGLNNSPYFRTNIEYTSSNGTVTAAVNYGADVTDNSAAVSGAPSTSQILAEVCKKYPSPNANGYYPVYVDKPRGNAGYCAWHSYGSCNGTQITFAFFFNLDNDSGCNPGDPASVHSPGLEALANVSGHEISEMVTDPLLNAWYDRQGAENSDKCAWTFSGTVKIGSDQWKIQGNYSNNAANKVANWNAYDGGGCIQTH